jgi:hypothetical protein
MKMKAYASFDQYLAGQAPRNQGVIRALRKFVKRVAPQLQESVKWGNGCWVQGKAPVAYVYSAPDYVQFGFFRGSALRDPSGLLEGAGKFVRHIKVRKRSDIDEKAFGTLLRQAALDVYCPSMHRTDTAIDLSPPRWRLSPRRPKL